MDAAAAPSATVAVVPQNSCPTTMRVRLASEVLKATDVSRGRDTYSGMISEKEGFKW
jgi:hypothetical protein